MHLPLAISHTLPHLRMKAAASRGLRRSVPVASVSLCRVERVVIAACQSAIIAKSSLASSASVSSRSVGSRMRLSTGSPAVVASAILCSCEMRADLTCLGVCELPVDECFSYVLIE